MSALKKRLLASTDGSIANSRADVDTDVVVIVDVIMSFLLLLRLLLVLSLSLTEFVVPTVVIQCTISTPLAFLDCFANARTTPRNVFNAFSTRVDCMTFVCGTVSAWSNFENRIVRENFAIAHGEHFRILNEDDDDNDDDDNNDE